MTKQIQPAVTSGGWSRRRSAVFRIAGIAAVILGGWCLWLGFQATPKPLEAEAFHEWDSQSAAPDRPEAPSRSQSPVGRPRVGITHIVVPHQQADGQEFPVVTAGQTADSESSDGELSVASFARFDRGEEPRRLSPDPSSTTGAWLTGTIEDELAAEHASKSAAQDIPAWKRGAKSRLRNRQSVGAH